MISSWCPYKSRKRVVKVQTINYQGLHVCRAGVLGMLVRER